MGFDPNIPTELTLTDAAQMRGQLNALKSLIDGLQAQVTAQQATIDSQQTQITAQQATIDGLNLQCGDMNTSIADLQDRVTALEGRCP
jgi:uncharacterized coiled-coil protein SlyX